MKPVRWGGSHDMWWTRGGRGQSLFTTVKENVTGYPAEITGINRQWAKQQITELGTQQNARGSNCALLRESGESGRNIRSNDNRFKQGGLPYFETIYNNLLEGPIYFFVFVIICVCRVHPTVDVFYDNPIGQYVTNVPNLHCQILALKDDKFLNLSSQRSI